MALIIYLPAAVFALVPKNTEAQEAPALMLTGQGRFAQFADLNTRSIMPDGRKGLRVLQISAEPMQIGAHSFIGGWSNWAFDCDARTAQRLDFASVRSDGHIGPLTPVTGEPLSIAAGGDADELAAVACELVPLRSDAKSVDEAVALARTNEAF